MRLCGSDGSQPRFGQNVHRQGKAGDPGLDFGAAAHEQAIEVEIAQPGVNEFAARRPGDRLRFGVAMTRQAATPGPSSWRVRCGSLPDFKRNGGL